MTYSAGIIFYLLYIIIIVEDESFSMYLHLMNSYIYATQKNHPYTYQQLGAEVWVYISSHCWPDFWLDYFSALFWYIML